MARPPLKYPHDTSSHRTDSYGLGRIGLWSLLHSKSGDQKYADWALKLIEHHWPARDPKSGILPGTTRGSQAGVAAVESRLSLAVSLLESASRLPPGKLKERCGKVGRGYAESVLRLPHRLEEGKFIAGFPMNGDSGVRAEYSEPYPEGAPVGSRNWSAMQQPRVMRRQVQGKPQVRA